MKKATKGTLTLSTAFALNHSKAKAGAVRATVKDAVSEYVKQDGLTTAVQTALDNKFGVGELEVKPVKIAVTVDELAAPPVAPKKAAKKTVKKAAKKATAKKAVRVG